MSRRFENIALAVLVAVAFGLCVAIAYQIGEHDAYNYASRSRADQELAANPAPPRLNRRPAADRSICQQSETEKEYELCQAWRSADAAKEAASVAWLQILLSAIALVGLYYTARYTAKAANAAADAAEHAARSVDVQIRAERALLYVEVTVNQEGQLPFILIKNAGKTPAILIEGVASLQVDGVLPVSPVYGKPWTLDGFVLEYGDQRGMFAFGADGQNLTPVNTGDSVAFCWGYVRYEDIFGRRRRLAFGRWTRMQRLAAILAGVTPRLSWLREGGDEYNHDVEEPEPRAPP